MTAKLERNGRRASVYYPLTSVLNAGPPSQSRSSRFTGKIHGVQIDLGVDDHDHFIDPDERFRIAMARQ